MSWNALADILEETKALLARPGTIFSWSHWRDQSEAIADLERLKLAIAERRHDDLSRVRLLFAPRGPIQQVSIATGWGVEFLKLADRLDRAVETILFSRNGGGKRLAG